MTDKPPDNTRGIIAPGRMMQRVAFARYAAPPGLVGLVDWFWSVAWDLPAGETHRQDVVSQPGVNVSVGTAPPPGLAPPPGPYPLGGVVNGVTTGLTTRLLRGAGWNLAAKTSTGGFGAWVDDVAALTDRVRPVSEVLPGWRADLAEEVAALDLASGVDLLGAELERLLDRRDPARVATAREVGRVAAVAERDRSVRRVEQLAAVAGVTPRTLQRLFAAYVGGSPTWVIRRSRLLDAAELVRAGEAVDWAAVAVDLGYADQAHLTRDFTATIGTPPAAYAQAQRDVPYGSGR